MLLAKVAQESLVAAGGGFAETEQGIQFLAFDALAFFRRVAGIQHLAHADDVARSDRPAGGAYVPPASQSPAGRHNTGYAPR